MSMRNVSLVIRRQTTSAISSAEMPMKMPQDAQACLLLCWSMLRPIWYTITAVTGKATLVQLSRLAMRAHPMLIPVIMVETLCIFACVTCLRDTNR